MKYYIMYKWYTLLYKLTEIQIHDGTETLLHVSWTIVTSQQLCTCQYVYVEWKI